MHVTLLWLCMLNTSHQGSSCENTCEFASDIHPEAKQRNLGLTFADQSLRLFLCIWETGKLRRRGEQLSTKLENSLRAALHQKT